MRKLTDWQMMWITVAGITSVNLVIKWIFGFDWSYVFAAFYGALAIAFISLVAYFGIILYRLWK